MNHDEKSHWMGRILFWILAIQLAEAWSTPQLVAAPADDNGPVQVGYAVITPIAPTTPTALTEDVANIVVFETFGERRGNQATQAGVLPSPMTTHAVLFVNTSGRLSRNLGIAIANPGTAPANITMTLLNDLGEVEGTSTIEVEPGAQKARFVTELFTSQALVSKDLIGTLDLTSDQPIAIVGLRFRGINFSTLPVTNLSGPAEVPVMGDGVGGSDAIILAHFAMGGGWATEIVIANTGGSAVTVRVDLFGQDGKPLDVGLNDTLKSSFTGITVPPLGVVTLAPRNSRGDSVF